SREQTSILKRETSRRSRRDTWLKTTPESNLPKLRAILYQLVRLTRLAEGQHTIHHRTNLTLRHKLHRLEQLRLRTHKRTQQRQMPIKHLPQISARIETTRRAARHQTSVILECRNRSGPRRRASVLDHNIDAFSVCQAFQFLG